MNVTSSSTASPQRLYLVRHLAHRGVDGVFDCLEIATGLVYGLATRTVRAVSAPSPLIGPRRLSEAAEQRSVPLVPDGAEAEPPTSPAREGAAAARAELHRPQPTGRPAPLIEEPLREEPDELVYTSGGEEPPDNR